MPRSRRPDAPGPRLADPDLPLRHPAIIVAAFAAAVGILLSVSFRVFDPDLFQHLRVGQEIWHTRAIPATEVWSWPTYGAPDVLVSWLYRVLLWPFWSVGGVWGLFAWRWLTALATFGLLWAVARRLGARGLVPLVVMVLCSLVYRQRSQMRPETLVAVLMALQLLILETRRQGGRDHSAWLVVIAWVWANAHISYYFGFVILATFWLDAWISARSGGGRRPAVADGRPAHVRLGLVILAAAAVSFLNPFGWRALWQPFDFYLHLRHELLYQTVGELGPIVWSNNRTNGLMPLMLGWPALVLWSALRGRFDRVEAALLVFFTALTLFGQRFLGFYAVVAAPYLARDLAALRLPAAAQLAAAPRAVLAVVAIAAVGFAEWNRVDVPLGIGFLPLWYPVAACDFMEAHGVRGRGFTEFDLSGYLLYRFWPQRDRLPFMDIHMTGTPRDRDLYARRESGSAWRELDGHYRFDYALVGRRIIQGNALLDRLDADSSYALVFADDVAALYVRRHGSLTPVAARFAYQELPAGSGRVPELQRKCSTDSAACDRLVRELERAVASSGRNARAHGLLANIALMRGHYAQAREHLRAALAIDPFTLRGHERLGLLALEEGDAREALREFGEERRFNGPLPGLDLRMGQVCRRLGDLAGARKWYQRELERDRGNQEARDSLAVLRGRP